jgi:hypothetical protein
MQMTPHLTPQIDPQIDPHLTPQTDPQLCIAILIFLRLPCYFSSKKITMRFCEDIRALNPKVNSASPPRSSFSLFVKKNDGNFQITARRLQIRAGSTPPPPKSTPKMTPKWPPTWTPTTDPQFASTFAKKGRYQAGRFFKKLQKWPPPTLTPKFASTFWNFTSEIWKSRKFNKLRW